LNSFILGDLPGGGAPSAGEAKWAEVLLANARAGIAAWREEVGSALNAAERIMLEIVILSNW